MAEVLAQYSDVVSSSDGRNYRAQACGAPMPDGLWEGWIEFIPADGGLPLRSPRETTQPNYKDAVYWATGLTPVYLEGALTRTLNPHARQVHEPAEALFDGPAPDFAARMPTPAMEAILDPFSVYEKGEMLLRKELGALSAWHLVNIIQAYRMSKESLDVLNRLPAAALVETIVTAVREHSPAR